jgi:pilus assembly protein CpaB
MSLTLRIIVIVLMLTTAAALFVIVVQIANPPKPVAPAETAAPPPQVSFLVAAHPLPAGTLARDSDFTTSPAPAREAPGEAIIDTPDARASLRGALIRAYLDTGRRVTPADILRPRDRGFIASVLAPGMRAVAIGVDPVSGVAGLIWPGDHVDVILTQEVEKAPVSHRVLSETILADVRVIAIDQEIVQGAPASNAAAGRLAHTVTLEVSPGHAEKVAVAQHLGKLALSIRAAADEAGAGVPARQTTFGADVSPALSRTDEPLGITVEVVEGGERKEVTFR